MKQIGKKLGSVFLALCLVLTLLPTTAYAEDTNSLETTIESYNGGGLSAEVSGNTVTVTGAMTEVMTGLYLDIDLGVTVIWKASITAAEAFSDVLIYLNGNGAFEVAEGGTVNSNLKSTTAIQANGDVTVSGGTVSAKSTTAIKANGDVTVSGGTVSSNSEAIYTTGTSSKVIISGGTVSATGSAIYTEGESATVTVSDSTVSSTMSTAIQANGTSSKVIISGGTVNSKSSTAIQANGDVTVNGGTVSSNSNAIHTTGTSSKVIVSDGTVSANNNAIRTDGASSTVTISGGTVSSTGSAIYNYSPSSSSTIIVSGGTVSSTSSAIVTEGESDTVTVSGGTVKNSATSSTYPVIYMHNINNTSDNVEVSGNGKVLAEGDGGRAILTYGNVTVKDSAQVSATTGIPIFTNGTSSTVIVSGGKVSNFGISLDSPVIRMLHLSENTNVEISGNGKVLAQGDGGSAIKTYGNVTVKDSAQVSATTGIPIFTNGTSSTVIVSGGSISNSATSSDCPVIYMQNTSNTSDNVEISGNGKVLAQGDGGYAIKTYGNVTVKENAQVSATTGTAIYANGASSTVTVESGMVFAYGTAITGENQVIYIPSVTGGFTAPTGDGVVIAWNKGAGTLSYDNGSKTDLTVLPADAAAWAKQGEQSGISYTKGTNSGFIAIDGVTVVKTAATVDQLSFTTPSNTTYNGSPQGIGPVKAVSGVALGIITVYYTGTGDTSYAKSTTPPTDIGTYQVTADVAESETYSPASNLALGTYTIGKAPAPTIIWPTATEIIYGDTLATSTLSGGSIEYGSFAWTNDTVIPSVTNGGYEVTFTQSASTLQNYETITDNTSTVSISVKKAGISGVNKTYEVLKNHEQDYSFDLTTLLPEVGVGKTLGNVTYSITSVSNTDSILTNNPSGPVTSPLTLNVATVAESGKTATITVAITSENYTVSDAIITITTVDKIPVTIWANITDKVYNGQPYSYNNVAVKNNTDNSDVTGSVMLEASYVGIKGTSYSQSTNAPKDAGDYQLILSVPDSNATYDGNKSFAFTIEKRPVTVTADNKSITKNGAIPNLTYTVNGQLSDEDALIGKPTLNCLGDVSKAGSYEITVSMAATTYTDNYKAADPAFVNGTLTVINPSSGGGPSSGGSSNATTPTSTISGSTATTTVEAKTSSDGKASASVTQSQMSSAIEMAQKAAKNAGEAPRVEIQVSGSSNASSTETTLPQSAIQALVTGEMESLTLSSPIATMNFDAQAIARIAGAASGDVAFTISNVENNTLSDTVRQIVGDRPVYDFSVTSGNNTISQFEGTVTVSIPYTPAVGEDVNSIVAYYINSKGEVELMQDCYYDAKAGVLVFTTTHFSQYAVGYNKVNFSDVADTRWYADAVNYLAARDITGGTSKTTFSPNAMLTRGQFITLVMRAYGIDPDHNSASNFSDAGNTYYTAYLASAKRLGISNGVGDNKFAPKQIVTRQEMFTLLYNTLKVINNLPEGNSVKTLSDFTDSGNISTYAQEAMSYLVKTGVVSGNNSRLNPTDTTTRAQMAQVLYNLLTK